MLVARQYETAQGRWSSRFDPLFTKPNNLRMSNYDGSSSLQSSWNGHMSAATSAANDAYTQAGEASPRGTTHDVTTSRLQNLHSYGGLRQIMTEEPARSVGSTMETHGVPAADLARSQATVHESSYSEKNPHNLTVTAESANRAYSHSLPGLKSSALVQSGPSSAQTTQSALPTSQRDAGEALQSKGEDDIADDDDDMLDLEGEDSGRPMTAAERTAARRKMKRFRLTHQQTRFLMSEFAKQPHPDAAHRERLSREIPGLSPRQVQVWFQNRRAKIKRLTADDRDRMIKMRAVPDDFDNVQALHSPYGAVHGLGTPMVSPSTFATPSYGDHSMMRPILADPGRRIEGDAGLSPAAIGSNFGGLGPYSSAGPMPATDVSSPLSTSPNERRYFSSHMTSPMSAGLRNVNPYGRPGGAENDSVRALQPLHLRENMSRARSESIQSPLRSSMSWKDGSIDYGAFPVGPGSPGNSGRQQSLYSTDHYETSSYLPSNTNINYSSVPPPSLQQPQRSRSTRLRAATASIPLGLDLRNQYRSVSLSQGLQPPQSAVVQRSSSSAPYAISSSFPSAPLTAPVDYTQPRTPGIQTSGADSYSFPQMSAPIAPPPDFGQAMHPGTGLHASSRTPIRDSFSNRGHINGHLSSASASDDFARTHV